MEIFKFLSFYNLLNVCLVCKKWYTICSDPLLKLLMMKTEGILNNSSFLNVNLILNTEDSLRASKNKLLGFPPSLLKFSSYKLRFTQQLKRDVITAIEVFI